VSAVSFESRFLLAYNAALSLASVALRATYGGPEEVSEQEPGELVTLATRLRAQLAAWLRARHPQLAP